MYGWRADEALGRDAREAVSLEMSDEELAEAPREIEQTGRLRDEQLHYHKDGTPIHVDSLTIAMRDERGETTGYLAIKRDVNERKRAQEEIETHTSKQSLPNLASGLLLTTSSPSWTRPSRSSLGR